MNLLLDTNALLGWMFATLARRGADLIGSPANTVFVSAVSVFEIAIKTSVGKLSIPESPIEAVDRSGFTPLDVTFEHADAVTSLPRHHRDPFDRLLIAQAQVEGLTIVTRDRRFQAYEVAVLPV